MLHFDFNPISIYIYRNSFNKSNPDKGDPAKRSWINESTLSIDLQSYFKHITKFYICLVCRKDIFSID